MSLIPWQPFGDCPRFFEDENWFLPVLKTQGKTTAPALDLYETDKEIVAEVNLPGIAPEKVEVSVKNQILEIKGHLEEKKEEKEKGYWRREIRKGAFERIVRLPSPVKEDKVEAICEKGVLKITMPKTETPKEKTAKIKVKSV